VARVAVGAVLICVAYVLWPLMGLASQMLDGVASQFIVDSGLTKIVGIVVLGVPLAVHAVGVLLVTGREPGGRRTRGGLRDRGVALALRACGVGAAVAVPLSGWYVPYWYGPDWYQWLWTGAHVMLVACPALAVWRLRWLTVRVGRPRVAEHAAIAGCGLSVASACIFWLGGAWSDRPWYWVFVLAFGIEVTCYLWCVGVMVMVARSLFAAAREARAAWRAADAAAGG
jgi:hypothetical protein